MLPSQITKSRVLMNDGVKIRISELEFKYLFKYNKIIKVLSILLLLNPYSSHLLPNSSPRVTMAMNTLGMYDPVLNPSTW